MNKVFLGIELGSTRIKAVLTDGNYRPVASGWHNWENKLEGGYWTYALNDAVTGVRDAFVRAAGAYAETMGEPLKNIDAIGISAMMHGYLAFDKDNNLLAPFRTWRNTTTAEAAEKLTDAFNFNIPQRWSIAHLYQAILNKEPHVKDIAYITTLAGYVHYKLTGEKVLGVGDASGMFPVSGLDYDKSMLNKFNELTGLNLENMLPCIKAAGEPAGKLTEKGAALLDFTGALKPGIPFCPPEGDAGTGMTATNSVRPRAGNVSAGTSVFAMLVLEKPLKNVYTEVDIVTTPTGKPVAMVHCNSCTSDIDAWINLFSEAAELMGASFDRSLAFERFYSKALEGAADCGGLLNYNFFSGEPAAGVENGCPMFLRRPDSRLNLADFMRAQLYSAVAALRLGVELLTNRENVAVDLLNGHGGLFKTKGAAAQIMADALNIPVKVAESAAEGGAWGIALLAAFAVDNDNKTLEDFLSERVFKNADGEAAAPNPDGVKGFNLFLDNYKNNLKTAESAAKNLK